MIFMAIEVELYSWAWEVTSRVTLISGGAGFPNLGFFRREMSAKVYGSSLSMANSGNCKLFGLESGLCNDHDLMFSCRLRMTHAHSCCPSGPMWGPIPTTRLIWRS